jgi:hypothetical protein
MVNREVDASAKLGQLVAVTRAVSLTLKEKNDPPDMGHILGLIADLAKEAIEAIEPEEQS